MSLTKKTSIGFHLFLLLVLAACNGASTLRGITVSNPEELKEAIKNAEPGDNIVMANGVWKDVEIKFVANGEEGKPITLTAETMGEVSLEGQSYIKLGGQYLVVKGLYFKNGYTPSNAVISFKKDKETLARYCRVTECVIKDYNQPTRDKKDHWVEFWGRHNQLDHCYIAGKSNNGPTVRVFLKGNESIKNYHKVVNNHFGPRPRKGGPRGETMQIGDSYTSMAPCNMMVADNLFEECNGEVEVISSKTNFNEFRGNVFYKSEGSLVTRHGSYCIIDGNYFIGDGSENIGGIRLINSGHWVTNNYFYNLKGKQFRSPLAMMNGIPKSPLNRYLQVTDAVVAYNTYVDCESPWHFGVGSNVSEADVLPKSEIRSARPDRCVVANNVIYSTKGDARPIMAHDSLDGITFKSNVISNNDVKYRSQEGLVDQKLNFNEKTDYLYVPDGSIEMDVYQGFDFETIETDIFGNERADQNQVGAIVASGSQELLDYSKYGVSWAHESTDDANYSITTVNPENLVVKLAEASAQDRLVLEAGTYKIDASLVIDKKIHFTTVDSSVAVEIIYTGAAGSPLFDMHPKGELFLSGVTLTGSGSNYAFASAKEYVGGHSHYNLDVLGCKVRGFEYVLKAYKESMAQRITFKRSAIENCTNGIELAEETNDKGDYNVEFLTFNECAFKNVKKNVVHYYRGGYDESTIGGNLKITSSTFSNCGASEASGILIKHRGIIHVDLTENTFTNNRVNRVAILWGAKDNHESGNTVVASGKIEVQQNLALKMMY